MYIFNKITVNPQLPKQIGELGTIANNLWWSWNTEFLRLFQRIDMDLWEQSNKNPVKFLKHVSQEKLEDAAKDVTFLKEYDKIVEEFEDYMNSKNTWFSKNYPEEKGDLIAYFSAEYGLDQTIAIYSGGLGILSGDHLKSASDLGIPLVAVGLLYKNGYFNQIIDRYGMQRPEYRDLDIYDLPITPVKDLDGNDLILSIDATVQGIAEKYLAEACIDNKCTDGGNIIIMNPQTGDILAMAGYPNYNLNQPYQANTEELKASWEMLAQGEKTKALQQMWRNKAVSDTYEPGSTFKLITTSAALEEGLTSVDKEGEFCCTGGIEIAGVRIKCWRYYRPHGSESLRQALMNSCNPVFIGLGQKIGVSKYYMYLKKFGLLKRTGIDLPGEAGSIFLKEEKVGPVELATIAFGQRFEITPLQLITAVSSIANGGTYIKPRIVKKIINSQTGETTEIPIKREERVISEETAKNVLSMMQSVVEDGTGRNAQVEGYNIGGKTGTSEDGVNTNKYVTSFMGVGPTTNPQVVILVTLYNPTGEGGHQGGAVAAPVGGKVLSEVLPYLEAQKDNVKEEDEKKYVEVPNIEGLTIEEAKKKLKKINLDLEIENEKDIVNTDIITRQIPKSGIKVKEGTKIMANV